MIFNSKKKKEERERVEKLEKARDLWLNYETRYACYYIHYNSPQSAVVKVFKFPVDFSRGDQRKARATNKDATWVNLAMKRASRYLTSESLGFWTRGEGLIIRHTLDVKFKEIDKGEYDRLQVEE